MPIQCKHCEDAPCLNACTKGAISRIDHQVIVDAEKCIGCKDCMQACPFAVSYTHLDVYKRQMQMMGIFAEFGEIRTGEPDSARAQQLVKKLQRCITDNYYTCSDKVLAELGRMYVEDKRFTENIDKAGGCGTAEFVYKAIECYCGE